MASILEQLKIAFSSSTCHPYFFFFLLVVLVLKLATRAKIKTSFNLPPSPKKLPIIGNLHQLGTLPYHSFRALSQKYGSLMLLQLGQTQALVVSSADVVREMMKTHDLAFSNRPKLRASEILLYGGNDIGFSSYGESWKQKRKICILQLLSPKRVQSLSLIREQGVAELVNKIHQASLSDASSVNLSELLMETIENIVSKCALGHKYANSRVKELARRVMTQLGVVTVGDHFPLLGWVDFLTGQIQEFKTTFRALDAFFDLVIADHKRMQRETNHCSTEKDFVDILIQLQEDGMLDLELTNDDIKTILLDMFVAGTETIASALEWTITELMKNPMKLKKVQEEVRKIVGHKSKVEEDDISQMNYMKCVVKEALRLHPPAPLLIPRETLPHLKLRGYDIPAKTRVYVNAWAIHRDPELWERPEEFIPERHENCHVNFKGQDFQFIPFGFGRRACPGMVFGLSFVEHVLANLLYRFNWKLPATATDIDMSERYGLVTSKKVSLHLKPISFSI
ncbi:hypothetical protein VNO78_13007 [Psophocarpus tetragonolobus]|uniref:Cytochrome P450 n=1 Tax=Psophocarpus tetragonolobus TaxID=3891 RepID=A0AAN9XPB4_PSOTE